MMLGIIISIFEYIYIYIGSLQEIFIIIIGESTQKPHKLLDLSSVFENILHLESLRNRFTVKRHAQHHLHHPFL